MKSKQKNLISLYNSKSSNRDIFHDLMPFKVKEILLFASVYDSYSIIRDGQYFDKIFGEYLQLNLYAAPRFTAVNSRIELLDIIQKKRFDMVIIMAGVDKETPITVSSDISFSKPKLPILLLVNNNSDLNYFQQIVPSTPSIDRMFVWNGNSAVFVAMIKYIEDKHNVKKDIQTGNVRVILLVEDSPKYYSRYLPLLYTSIMKQTQDLVAESNTEDLDKILKMRARPKVLLVSVYEEAISIINEYKKNLLCVISDVKYEMNGVDDEDAGVELLKYVRANFRDTFPTLLQSHDISNKTRADQVNSEFVHKSSEMLSHQINNFINIRLGFGDFFFKDSDGNIYGEAANIDQFESQIKSISGKSIAYHAVRRSFPTWLMARGEINLAEQLLSADRDTVNNPQKYRELCLNCFKGDREQKLLGKIIKFRGSLSTGSRYILRIGDSSLGGKGRGLAFVSELIENTDLSSVANGIDIKIPATTVLGAGEFDKFIDNNRLTEKIYHHNNDYDNVKELFLNGKFSRDIKAHFYTYLTNINRPIAVRSSGLFEDSLTQPFSGVYATYILPNNDPDINVRQSQLEEAIKLIYSSAFSDHAKRYFDIADHNIEEEKMAIVIQELVGKERNGKFYPAISGTAQSYNYYPFSYMKPEDGFSVIAIGLGTHVVGGERAWRFCPRYPKLINSDIGDQVRDSQKHFYAVDMSNTQYDFINNGEEAAIKRYRIKEAEEDGILNDCISVYDRESEMLIPGDQYSGPKVVNFANILQYDKIPLASTIKSLLSLFEEAMGTSVEMEYAVDLNSETPAVIILQIKPLIKTSRDFKLDRKLLNNPDNLMTTTNGMGNGLLQDIDSIVWIDPDRFEKTDTKAIAQEVREVNKLFREKNQRYLLIGPGRWGTRDIHTGIPVLWTDISEAKAIIEMGLENFPLDGSLGSHFFHNVTSMNIGYFSIPFRSSECKLNLSLLDRGVTESKGTYVRVTKFEKPFDIKMDGYNRLAVVSIN